MKTLEKGGCFLHLSSAGSSGNCVQKRLEGANADAEKLAEKRCHRPGQRRRWQQNVLSGKCVLLVPKSSSFQGAKKYRDDEMQTHE